MLALCQYDGLVSQALVLTDPIEAQLTFRLSVKMSKLLSMTTKSDLKKLLFR